MKKIITAALCGWMVFASSASFCRDEIVLTGITESSGVGAIAGNSFRNGYMMAIEEINAGGGIAGVPLSLKQIPMDSTPEAAKTAAIAAVASHPYAILGPVYSGLTLASLSVTGSTGIPQFSGGEAAAISKKFPSSLFRTALTQELSVPRLAKFIRAAFQPKKITIIYISNDYGTDGKELLINAFKRYNLSPPDISAITPGQTNFVSVINQLKASNPDLVVIYANELESVGILKELHAQQWNKPIVGDSALVSQQVLRLAGSAAEGVYAHTSQSIEVPTQRVQRFTQRFETRYSTTPDHNSIKGYFAVYAIKSVLDSTGAIDQPTFVSAIKKARFDPAKQENLLSRASYDIFGTLYRESYLVQIKNGRQIVMATIPLGEEDTVTLPSGKEVILDTRDGRKLFFSQQAANDKK